jgi:2-methylaconitate cis-trans-isomerase PrpF
MSIFSQTASTNVPRGAQRDDQQIVKKDVMSRSARVLMEGWVRIPGDAY